MRGDFYDLLPWNMGYGIWNMDSWFALQLHPLYAVASAAQQRAEAASTQ